MTLTLGERAGLPDEVAVLRARFPAAGWRGHANFGQLAAFWLQVHASLRQEGAEVVRLVEALRARQLEGAAFAPLFVARLNGFLGHLDGHHRIEDQAYFPKFRQLDPRLVVGFDLLEADHQAIHAQLEESVTHARALLVALGTAGADHRLAADAFSGKVERLVALLDQHLSDEEELVIPALLEHGETRLG